MVTNGQPTVARFRTKRSIAVFKGAPALRWRTSPGFEHNDYSCLGEYARGMMVARKRPKIRLLRARGFLLGADVASLIFFLFIASGGLRYPVSTGIQLAGWIGLAAVVFALLILPRVWKPLGHELRRYVLARGEVFARWKRVLYLGAGLAVAIEILLVVWPAAGRTVGDVLSELAFPLMIALGIIELAIFWVLDRRVMRQVVRAVHSH